MSWGQYFMWGSTTEPSATPLNRSGQSSDPAGSAMAHSPWHDDPNCPCRLAGLGIRGESEVSIRATLAAFSERDPMLVASALAAHRTRYGLSRDERASWLGCSIEGLDQIALRRRPRDRDGALAIAASVGTNPERLAELLGYDSTDPPDVRPTEPTA